jgi:hypothetical protein
MNFFTVISYSNSNSNSNSNCFKYGHIILINKLDGNKMNMIKKPTELLQRKQNTNLTNPFSIPRTLAITTVSISR